MRYFICANDDELSKELVEKIRNTLKLNADFLYDEKEPEIVISIGGDGRFLKTIQKYLLDIQNIGIVGISTGALGYLCDYKDSDIDKFLKDISSVSPKYESRSLIEVYANQNVSFYVNEFRLESVFKTFKCDVFINDSYFESYRGNGLIFASSTGSTALNKSLGGPIVSNGINCMIMGEIAPINNSISRTLNSFLVLSSKDVVTLRGNFDGCSFGGDNFNELFKSNQNDSISIRLSKIKVKLAHFRRENFYEKVKDCFIERK